MIKLKRGSTTALQHAHVAEGQPVVAYTDTRVITSEAQEFDESLSIGIDDHWQNINNRCFAMPTDPKGKGIVVADPTLFTTSKYGMYYQALPIDMGGTGAKTVAGARSNLGIVTCTQQEYNSTSDKTNKIFFIVG